MPKVEITKRIPRPGGTYDVGAVLNVNSGLALKWQSTGHAKTVDVAALDLKPDPNANRVADVPVVRTS